MLSTMILAISGKCHPYHSYKHTGRLLRLLHTPGDAYLDTHCVYVDLLVKVIEECDGLNNHSVHLIW